MMKKLLLGGLLPLFFLTLMHRCTTPEYFHIGFYNVENLFDTIDNPHKRDNSFLPDGKKKWDTEKYFKKIDHLAQVIDAMPELILLGLCEVENKHVLADLKAHDLLSKKGYSIIHKQSPDGRGIDNAAFYRADFFTLIDYHYYRIKLPGRTRYSTRDILYIKGLPFNKDTLHIFINHWPSRYGGEEKTRPDRMFVSNIITQKIDSLKSRNADSKFIVMGDLNDTPKNESVRSLLKKCQLNEPALKRKDSIGTYNYRGEWDVLDHILYSENLKSSKTFTIPPQPYSIFHPDFILHEKRSGAKVPNRTYGYKYFGGYSDHLPVFFKMGAQ